jgi:hypothetical protein
MSLQFDMQRIAGDVSSIYKALLAVIDIGDHDHGPPRGSLDIDR